MVMVPESPVFTDRHYSPRPGYREHSQYLGSALVLV